MFSVFTKMPISELVNTIKDKLKDDELGNTITIFSQHLFKIYIGILDNWDIRYIENLRT